MVICELCNRNIPFFKGYVDNKTGLDFCNDCWENHQNKINKKRFIEWEQERKEKEKQLREKSKIMEYRRKCNKCKKVWYSQSRLENSADNSKRVNAFVALGTIFSNNITAATQAIRNSDAQEAIINSLRKCPNCGTTDYKEEVTYYYPKKT